MISTIIRLINSIIRIQRIYQRKRDKNKIENELFSIYCDDIISHSKLFYKFIEEQGFNAEEKIEYFDNIIDFFKISNLTNVDDFIVHGKTKYKWLSYSNYKNVKIVLTAKEKEEFWDAYYKFCNDLIIRGRQDISTKLKDAKKNINGLTEGWFDFKMEMDSIYDLYKTEFTHNEQIIFESFRIEINKNLNYKK